MLYKVIIWGVFFFSRQEKNIKTGAKSNHGYKDAVSNKPMEQLMHQSFVLYLYVDFHIRVQLFLRRNSKKKTYKMFSGCSFSN